MCEQCEQTRAIILTARIRHREEGRAEIADAIGNLQREIADAESEAFDRRNPILSVQKISFPRWQKNQEEKE